MRNHLILFGLILFYSCKPDLENGIQIREIEFDLNQDLLQGNKDLGEFRAFEIINESDNEFLIECTKNNKITFPTSRQNFANGETIHSIIDRNWTEYESSLLKPLEVDTIITYLHFNTRDEDSSRIGFTFFNTSDSLETEYFITLSNLKK